ncbi:hypothetical protein FRC03_004687 [Tulasnella sp. 419]|nr:hypothetical protein FRC03_004687 [Tulasnella sp. 419]
MGVLVRLYLSTLSCDSTLRSSEKYSLNLANGSRKPKSEIRYLKQLSPLVCYHHAPITVTSCVHGDARPWSATLDEDNILLKQDQRIREQLPSAGSDWMRDYLYWLTNSGLQSQPGVFQLSPFHLIPFFLHLMYQLRGTG